MLVLFVSLAAAAVEDLVSLQADGLGSFTAVCSGSTLTFETLSAQDIKVRRPTPGGKRKGDVEGQRDKKKISLLFFSFLLLPSV